MYRLARAFAARINATTHYFMIMQYDTKTANRHARALKSHVLAQMAICVPINEIRSAIYVSSEGSGESAQFHSTCSLQPSSLDNAIPVPKSRAGDLCDIYESSEGSGESAYLRMLA